MRHSNARNIKVLRLALIMAFVACCSGGCAHEAFQRYKYGLRHTEKGDYDSAEVELKAAIELMPEALEFHTGLGNLYLKQKEYELALSMYYEAHKRFMEQTSRPKRIERMRKQSWYSDLILGKSRALYELAEMRYNQGMFLEAGEYYVRLIHHISPPVSEWVKPIMAKEDMIKAYVRAARVKEAGHKDVAVSYYEKALKLDPDNAVVQKALDVIKSTIDEGKAD